MEEAPATQIPCKDSEDPLYVIVSFLDSDCLPAVLPTSGRASDPREENITHIFFPVRWIPFKTKRQLNDPAHPDYDAVHKATEKDEAKLGRWLDCVDEMLEGKCRVERDKFEFSVMKELHPMVEWRNVSSPPPQRWWSVADDFDSIDTYHETRLFGVFPSPS